MGKARKMGRRGGNTRLVVIIEHFVDFIVSPGLDHGFGQAEPGRVRGALQFGLFVHKLAPQSGHLAYDCAPRTAGEFEAEFVVFLHGVFAH